MAPICRRMHSGVEEQTMGASGNARYIKLACLKKTSAALVKHTHALIHLTLLSSAVHQLIRNLLSLPSQVLAGPKLVSMVALQVTQLLLVVLQLKLPLQSSKRQYREQKVNTTCIPPQSIIWLQW